MMICEGQETVTYYWVAMNVNSTLKTCQMNTALVGTGRGSGYDAHSTEY